MKIRKRRVKCYILITLSKNHVPPPPLYKKIHVSYETILRFNTQKSSYNFVLNVFRSNVNKGLNNDKIYISRSLHFPK